MVDPREEAVGESSPTRQTYVTPSLVLLGDVTKLTLGIGGSVPDNGQDMPSKNGIG